MAGHSKWKQIKHYKAATDAKRGAQFTKLIREITMAAKLSGGDPAHNPRLRTAIDAAKAKSMPKENIERAIKKGTGEIEGVHYTEVTYEGYGPGGVAILISALSDNPTRTVAEIRHKLTRLGGNLGRRISTWTSSKCPVRDAQPVTVLGIDPGTAITGYGIVRKEGRNPLTLVECGVIRTRPRDELAQRLAEIHDGVLELIRRHKPTVLSIEDIFYARNVRTTVVLGHPRGVILLAGAQAGLDIHEYPPSEIKKAVAGTGAGTKLQIQFMVTRLLRLKSAPQPSDAADGVAAALAYALMPDLPKIEPIRFRKVP